MEAVRDAGGRHRAHPGLVARTPQQHAARRALHRVMIPLAIPNLAGNEARYLQECVATNFVSSVGPFVGRFETMVAESCGTPGAVATASGTAALHVMLAAFGVG